MKTQGAWADCSQPLEGGRQEGREVGVGPRFVAPALVFWKALIILCILLHNPRSSSGTCQTSGQDVEFGKLGSLELQIKHLHSAALYSERLYKMERKEKGMVQKPQQEGSQRKEELPSCLSHCTQTRVFSVRIRSHCLTPPTGVYVIWPLCLPRLPTPPRIQSLALT